MEIRLAVPPPVQGLHHLYEHSSLGFLHSFSSISMLLFALYFFLISFIILLFYTLLYFMVIPTQTTSLKRIVFGYFVSASNRGVAFKTLTGPQKPPSCAMCAELRQLLIYN